jgi:hypothetical protein
MWASGHKAYAARCMGMSRRVATSSLQELQNFLVFVAGGLPIAKYKPQGFAGRAAVSIQPIAHHFLAKVLECAMAAVLAGCRVGEAAMVTRILNDLLCLTAFITGIVLAAATLLI